MSGTLYMVGTPIGNLGDITLRALETLKSVDRIYAEDTRRTLTLLTALGITGKKLSSLHAHSSERTFETALEILTEGRSIAVVTDAGMPSVSDPGAELVRRAQDAGITVTAAPGASAVTTAVALSGLVESAFVFLGFLPRKGRKRAELLTRIERSDIPVIFFESPSRISATLGELAALCPHREVAACRELTKRFEEVRRGSAADLANPDLEWLGELTVVVAAQDAAESRAQAEEEAVLDDERIAELLSEGLSVKDVVQQLLRPGLSKRALYAQVQAFADAGRAEEEPDQDDDGDDGDDEPNQGSPDREP